MKIAVVGAGISGIYAAHRLAMQHDVTLYEANGYLGGHTDTHHVTTEDRICSVDTGFIVFNETNYPLFTSFIKDLGVQSQPTNMSFSVSEKRSGLEYNATNLKGLFCQRKNLVSPRFYRMLIDILRFYKHSPELLTCDDDDLTIGAYLQSHGYGEDFVNNHIVPMASALWSSPAVTVAQFPARYFVAFMHNHKMLQVAGRPVWRTITGGSSQYVRAFERNFSGSLRVHSPVREVTRTVSGAMVKTDTDVTRYDAVILACHSDQAIALLSDATDRERTLLGAIPYQQNEITLHTDVTLMPDHPDAWASWNVIKPKAEENDFIVSYWMNMLQGIDTSTPLLVSLNASHLIDKEKVLLNRCYHHPVYTPESLRAQKSLGEYNGYNSTYFAGAYMGWGFHEDGVRSAQQVVDAIAEKELSRAA
ncbi:MAG: FAD-dependent oxidoreductase [Arenicellales bacterium]|nr:FAD-dependent oxidoreductase [Arenicellales bacterium]